LIYALVILVWTMLRLPETLRPEYRTPFRPRAITGAYLAVLRNKQTIGYMLATTFMTACLFAYITCSEQIYVDVHDLGPAFPLAFAAIALAISFGTYLNSRLVIRHGMRRISHTMSLGFTAIVAAHALLALVFGVSFWVFLALLAIAFSVFGLISSNFNALAMEPVGHIAGSASALYGAVTATGGAILGALIARAFDGTVAPFLIGLTLAGAATIAALLWTEGRLTLRAGVE
jgi:DHA1 family bicyclomycin/chloramphenicol resistance-like MFS transporter